jgi:hypothetical protein
MIAGAFDDAEMTPVAGEQQVREQFEEMVRTGACLPRCRICGSETFHYETARTRFNSMAEADPVLMDVEAANIAAGDILQSF